MDRREESVDVVVVGAGLSGVVAARALKRAGKRVLVLEGRERVGGRLVTTLGPHGLCLDRGGQWIGPGQNRIQRLVTEFGFKTHPTTTQGKTCFELAGRSGASRIGFPLSRPLVLLGTALGMGRLQKLANAALKRDPKEKPNDISLGHFIEQEVWPEGARDVLRVTLEATFCSDLDEVSLELALYAIGCCGGLAHMQAVKGGAQESLISSGAGALVERIAAELRDDIRLNSAVTKLQHQSASVIVETHELRVQARHAIVAIPPPLVARMEWHPPLDTPRQELWASSKMGSVIKYNLIYRTPFWRKSGLSGAIWSTSGPVSVCYDTTPADTEYGVLSALSVAATAKQMGSLEPQQRRSKVLEMLASHLGSEAEHPLEYLDLVWSHEPLIEGGYSITLPPGAFAAGPSALRTAVGPVHFAGTETAVEYPGYMEGAVEAGERAAREVLGR
jgi:monoamine oxidase